MDLVNRHIFINDDEYIKYLIRIIEKLDTELQEYGNLEELYTRFLKEFGKTIFPKKEDAEKALKEMEK